LVGLCLVGCGGPRVFTPTSSAIYAAHQDALLQVDYYPARPDVPTDAPAPAVLLLHGGGWENGNRRVMYPLPSVLTRIGFTCFCVDYRLVPRNPWPAQQEDVRTAMRFIRNNAKAYNIDPNRIAAVGVSAGGQLAMELGTGPDKANAVGSVAGVADFRLPLGPRARPRRLVENLLRGLDPGPASPIEHFNETTSPTYFLHGDKDLTVPLEQSALAMVRLMKLGVPTEMEIREGKDHPILPHEKPEDGGALRRMGRWLMKAMEPKLAD